MNTARDITPVKLAFNLIEPESCDKEKAPIIFMHGLTASKEHWNDIPQLVADATKRKVYVIDTRNHGDSEWSEVFNLECIVSDLVNFMDSINAPKAILVGHSLGGITGIRTALHRPEKVEKLILEDIGVEKIPQQVLDLSKMYFNLTHAALQQIPPGVDEDTAQKLMVEYIVKNFPQNVPEEYRPTSRMATVQRFVLKRDADGCYTLKANMKTLKDNISKLQNHMDGLVNVYEGPTYCIYGKSSPFSVGKQEDLFKQFFPKVELIGIEKATHAVHTDCPQEFTEALLKCLLK